DFVADGAGAFNHLDGAGVPTFTSDSSKTLVPIEQSSLAAAGNTSDLARIKDDIAKQSPLVDTVRRWVAPYSGIVSILAPVTLTPPDGTTSKDGVRVAIQYNDHELDAQELTTTGATAFTAAKTQAVNAGDHLYFRVGSIFDGASDQ